MTLAPLLARLERGFHWCGRKIKAAWNWLTAPFKRRPAGTVGQQEQERETRASLGLMAQAADAGQNMTPEQQIFLSQSEHGMRERLSVLLGIPHRSLAQEREKVAIEQWLARDSLPSHLVRTNAPARPAGFMAPMAAMAVRPWMIWTGAVVLLLGALGIQTGRLENAKADLREERAEVAGLQEEVMLANAERDMLREAVSAATQQSAQAAETIEAERARRLRAEREARSIRNAMEQARRGESVDYGFGGVRDDGAVSPGPGGGDTAGRRPS